MTAELLRPHAEQVYASELAALAKADDRPQPPSWRLSPQAVVTYLLGGELDDGTVITPKYVGPRRLVEVAVATLATDRALLLLGAPGTAKTWVSEHLSAAISGDSTLLVQGTSGTAEEAIRYGWNYARLLAEGPSEQALVPSPVMTAMREGRIARVEELTRIPSDVQDALITILSEKSLPVPELGAEVQARKGFSVIATANDRDRGVNELSSRAAPPVQHGRAAAAGQRGRGGRPSSPAASHSSARLSNCPRFLRRWRRSGGWCTVFRELRSGITADQRTKLKSPTGTLSPAEAISVVTNGIALAAHFGDGVLRPGDVAAGIIGAIVKDPVSDATVWAEYLEAVVRQRPGLGGLLHRLPGVSPVDAAASGAGVLGIRHHGPGSARSVAAELDRVKPGFVLIEGPADANPVLALAAWPGMVPPVALLAYAPDEPKVSAFWPYAVFSPEWQALTWALAHDVPVRFCDLPAAMVLAGARGGSGQRRRTSGTFGRRRPDRAPSRGGRIRRPGTLVGRRDRVAARRRVAVSRPDRGHGGAAGGARGAAARTAARGAHAAGAARGAEGDRRAGRGRVRRLARARASPGRCRPRRRTQPFCGARRSGRPRSRGCRGRTRGSRRPPGTGPGSPRPAGTTTCSRRRIRPSSGG